MGAVAYDASARSGTLCRIVSDTGVNAIWTMEGTDGRRMDRAAVRLGNSDSGLAWLRMIGVNMPFAKRAGIGIDTEDETGLCIVHVARSRDGRRRLAQLRVDETGAMRALTSGAPVSLWSSAPQAGSHALVLPDLATMWRLAQAVGDEGLEPYVVIAPSHPGLPIEWRDKVFWRDFSKVTVLADDPSGGALLATVAAAVGPTTTLALPGHKASWRELLAPAAGFNQRSLELVVEDAPPLAFFMGRGEDAIRSDAHSVGVHGLDGEGRLMRVLRLEERFEGGGRHSDERHRMRSVVVRSDGMFLDIIHLPAPAGTPPGDRVVALSDGTRLDSEPSVAASTRWSLGSARAFVAAPSSNDVADDLFDEIAAEVGAVTGLQSDIAEQAAAFVMTSYVYQAFDQLRVPVFHAGTPRMRVRLAGALAQLSHLGLVRARSRANVLAYAADEMGGALILHEPGCLAGPEGPTEIGRFLVTSSVAGSTWDHVGGSGRRALRIFGPRAVVAQRRPAAACGEVTLDIELLARGTTVRPPDRAVCASLVDRLYRWSMTAIGEVRRRSSTNGKALSAILMLNGDNASPDAPSPAPQLAVIEGEAVMREALKACTADGQTVVSITQLMLEVGLRGRVGPDYSPERVGRWLAGSGELRAGVVATRRRLHGHIARLYEVETNGPEVASASADPFAFCTANSCETCKYQAVCSIVVPGLRDRKSGGV